MRGQAVLAAPVTQQGNVAPGLLAIGSDPVRDIGNGRCDAIALVVAASAHRWWYFQPGTTSVRSSQSMSI